MNNPIEIQWLNEPAKDNYPEAFSYLSLIYKETLVIDMIKKLKKAPVIEFKAKDILRASNLTLLGISNSHIEKDRDKIKKGTLLSPIFLVRDSKNGKVIIADGYHRVCAIYTFDEDAIIKCKII